jgi:hypothetical protein
MRPLRASVIACKLALNPPDQIVIVPASVTNDNTTARLYTGERGRRKPIPDLLSDYRRLGFFTILEWIVNDEKPRTASSKRTAYACGDHASAFGGLPLLHTFRSALELYPDLL